MDYTPAQCANRLAGPKLMEAAPLYPQLSATSFYQQIRKI